MHRARLQADAIVDGPQDAPWDRFATLDDPDGNGIVLAGPPAEGRVTHGHGGRRRGSGAGRAVPPRPPPRWQKATRMTRTTRESEQPGLSELDLAIVNVLQTSPRLPLDAVAREVGSTPSTVGRRWKRLEDEGWAWVTCYPAAATVALAFLDVDCAPGSLERVTSALAALPCAVTIERTAGPRPLTVLAAGRDHASLARSIDEDVVPLPGATAVGVSLLTRLYLDGAHWTLRSLPRDQIHRLRSAPPPPPAAEPADALDQELITILTRDGRRSLARPAADLGVGAPTVRRHLDRLTSTDARLRLNAAGGSIDDVAGALAALPETRLVAAATGGHNLLATLWLRHPHDAHRIERSLTDRFPGLAVTERTVALYTPKRLGRMLRTDGRTYGYVPPPAHQEPEAARTRSFIPR
ncbi:Lrp/AsnC family transcriptional regulator [Streptomyces sp. NPDC048182]|uniref:Lrp/AsnC family transcriptional regulator n=1 Tax=Streptomyces sp. NPDC048182 TaxID=3365507 RepID=UPI00371C2439